MEAKRAHIIKCDEVKARTINELAEWEGKLDEVEEQENTVELEAKIAQMKSMGFPDDVINATKNSVLQSRMDTKKQKRPKVNLNSTGVMESLGGTHTPSNKLGGKPRGNGGGVKPCPVEIKEGYTIKTVPKFKLLYKDVSGTGEKKLTLWNRPDEDKWVIWSPFLSYRDNTPFKEWTDAKKLTIKGKKNHNGLAIEGCARILSTPVCLNLVEDVDYFVYDSREDALSHGIRAFIKKDLNLDLTALN